MKESNLCDIFEAWKTKNSMLMKTTIAILALFASLNANAQLFSDNSYQKDFWDTPVTTGVIVGCVGQFDDLHQAAFGLSGEYAHFHVDFMGWPRWHSSSESEKQWKETTSFAFHLGFELPITERFSLTPIVGYTNVVSGVTDGENYKIDEDGDRENAFYVKKRQESFDFGGIATVRLGKIVNVKATLTRHSVWAGVSFVLE